MGTVLFERGIDDQVTSPHTFTEEEVLKMYEHDILPPDERLELLDGQLYQMSLKNLLHIVVLQKLISFFKTHFSEESYLIDKEVLLDFSKKTMPEPDSVIAKQRPAFWKGEHVKVSDVVLLIEVANSSLSYDSGLNKNLYEQVGVPIYWVISLSNQQIHTFSNWRNEPYEVHTTYKKGSIEVEPLNLSIAFADIFLEQ